MIRRGGSWPGWRWLDHLDTAVAWESAGPLALVPLLLELLTVPARLFRWISYRLRRRCDWDVTVYAGVQGDYRPPDAGAAGRAGAAGIGLAGGEASERLAVDVGPLHRGVVEAGLRKKLDEIVGVMNGVAFLALRELGDPVGQLVDRHLGYLRPPGP